MRVTVSRKAHFNAAHRLYVKSWDEKKNDLYLESVLMNIMDIIMS